MVGRIRQALADEYGLGYLLAFAEQMSSHAVRESGTNDSLKTRLEKTYHWKSDPAALNTRQMY